MNYRKSIAKHLVSSSAWAFASQIVSNIAAVVYIGMLTRLLNPEDMGSYLLLFSLAFLLVLLGNFGIPEALVRTIARETGNDNRSFALCSIDKSLNITAFTSAATGIILPIAWSTGLLTLLLKLSIDLSTAVFISLWVVLACFQSLFSAVFRGFHNIRDATLFGATLKNLFSVAIVAILSFTLDDFSLETAIWCSILALFINNIAAFTLLRPLLKQPANSSNVSVAGILSVSKTFMFNMLLVFLVMRIGLWALGYYQPKTEVALFGTCLQLVAILTIPLLIVNSFAPPLIADMYFNEPNHARLESILRKITTIAAVPSALICIIFLFFGDRVLELVFGSFYKQGHALLALLAAGQLANILVGPTGNLLKMTNHQTTLMKINTGFTIVITVLTIYSARTYGALGVAGILGISLLLQNLITLYVAKEKTGILCSSYFKPGQYRDLFNEILHYAKRSN